MAQAETGFQYSLIRRDMFLVVSLAGELLPSALESFERCKTEISNHLDAKAIILEFSGIKSIALEVIPTLAQIQRIVRGKELELRISGLSPELVDKLDKRGVLRKTELATNLTEAVSSAHQRLRSQRPKSA